MNLEDHYAGDEAWNLVVSQHIAEPISGEIFDRDMFEELPENVDDILAVAVSFFGAARTLEWLDEQIPALNCRTPRECLSSVELLTRVREYFIRFPV